MDPINSRNSVLATLRRELAANVERLRKTGRLREAQSSKAAEGSAESLEGALRRKIKSIDRKTKDGRLQAARTFVEVVLAAEFGEALVSDPGFGFFLQELSASLTEDADLRSKMDMMFDQL